MGTLAWIAMIILAAGVVFFLRSQYERDQLVTTEYEIRSGKLSPEFDGQRFVYLTDIHDKEFGRNNERLLQALRETKPDMVLIGGDSMVVRSSSPSSVKRTLSLLEKLSAEYTVYYYFGNHELRLKERTMHRQTYEELLDGIRRFGVKLLDNRSMSFHGCRGSLTLTGLTMPKEAYPKFRKEPLAEGLIERQVGIVPKEDFRILMAHTPLYREEYAAWGADVTLCGHYHGGNIYLPVIGGVMSPDYHLFPGICRGRFETGGKIMIVSGGLGTHSINIRFGNKPQIIVLRLHSTEGGSC